MKIISAGVVSLLLSLGVAHAEERASQSFNISAQSLSSALGEFAKQSQREIVFTPKVVKDKKTAGVKGTMEALSALSALLKDTGLTYSTTPAGAILVGDPRTVGATSGAGLQDLHVAQHEAQQMQKVQESSTSSEPTPASSSDSAAGSDDENTKGIPEILVRGSKSFNIDVTRSIDDVQPYYIFDSQTIEQSGATNIEDFLKQRLTMNTVSQTRSMTAGGESSHINEYNLRGLGSDKTLILVNGRRMAGVNWRGSDYQPDLDGIPLSGIDRIEVLPSSASGIYGGRAIGGVINVVLKKNFKGGEVRVSTDNTWDAGSGMRSISATYGTSLEGGKSHVMAMASASDSSTLLLKERLNLVNRARSILEPINPDSSFLFFGAAPNIQGFEPLVLKDGTPLNSDRTSVPLGTPPTTSTTVLNQALLQNAGLWNIDTPNTTDQNGMLRPVVQSPEMLSLMASFRREMSSNVEVLLDYSHNRSRSTAPLSSPQPVAFLDASTPGNPFDNFVIVRFPSRVDANTLSDSTTDTLTGGLVARLPQRWTGSFDYTWSRNRYRNVWYLVDPQMNVDANSGALNLFVDTAQYVDTTPYLYPIDWNGSTTSSTFALRATGELFDTPVGAPLMTLGLEHRRDSNADNSYDSIYPFSTSESSRQTYYSRAQNIDSAYGEMQIPLVRDDALPLLHALELQLSGRIERYIVDTGTPSSTTNLLTGEVTYASPVDENGQPIHSETKYSTSHYTVGLKYSPVRDIIVRASTATAFLPPTPDQLFGDPIQDPYLTTIFDPVTGTEYQVHSFSGGSADLKPQSSKSYNAGVIFEPAEGVLQGLRLNAEYYSIEQSDAIVNANLQTFIDHESSFPDRVTRDDSGLITVVDASLVNFYKRESNGWDLSADYRFSTAAGILSLHAGESIIQHLKEQYSLTLPEYDAVDFPSEGGAARYKGNFSLTWERQGWSAGWLARYTGSYKQRGAAGGPLATQDPDGFEASGYYTHLQGSDTIPAQTYHDMFVSFRFGDIPPRTGSRLAAAGTWVLDGLTIQGGVKNVFNKMPPYDVYSNGPFYYSPYGDIRMRTYWLEVKKQFN